MTTLVGIMAEQGEPGIVLASDLNRSGTEWVPRGDVAVKKRTKSEGQKIYVSDDRTFAVCMSGDYDAKYIDFLTSLRKGRINLKSALKKGFFKELELLNLSRWGGEVPDTEQMTALLIASRFDKKLELSLCYPLGKIIKNPWISIGSGSEYASEHIRKADKHIPGYVTTGDCVDLACYSLKEANKDAYTFGLDVAVVTNNDVVEYGEQIKNAIKRAESRVIRDIKGQVSENGRSINRSGKK